MRAEAETKRTAVTPITVIVVALVLAWLMIQGIDRPMGQLSEASRELGSGLADLIQRISVNGRDEIADELQGLVRKFHF